MRKGRRKGVSVMESNTASNSQSPSPANSPATFTRSLAELEHEADNIILSGLREDDSPRNTPTRGPSRSNSIAGSFTTKMSLSSIMPSLSGLSLTRTSTNEEKRGRKPDKNDPSSRSSSAMRSMSPFRRRSRTRDRSPSVEALRHNQSDYDSDAESVPGMRAPRNAFTDGDSSSGSEEEEEDLPDDFDEETEDNTEKNAVIEPFENPDEVLDHEPDPLGEGVNVVRPEEPMFQNAASASNPRRKRTLRTDVLPLETHSPIFQKDRCTVTIVHGDPSSYCVGKPVRKFMVASDLSEEAKYAAEWAIGTVLRNGNELNQQERQALAYLLSRQATALLQRTKLHVTVKCQAIHSKNSRHTLLDLIDAIQPVMVIVGSRGIGKLKGILLGSTSHYLIQAIMVARRRLKRPVRHNQLPPQRTKHVSLAEANIEKAGKGSAEKDVMQVRNEIAQEEASRNKVGFADALSPASPIPPAMGSGLRGDDESDSESEEEVVEGTKVPGTS
ncbi:hypothetical protein PIIN_00706 [Serendipita indica DSM 11827]|uniref:UspA domain-containing protein n=1 Tax=Serendipita indica (strain DSM 11827) TaxID=1109443 RepID=G4U321_SERID|nr:hypothetical protein PIIN_00706 [Serendipita indica DSM 11827]